MFHLSPHNSITPVYATFIQAVRDSPDGKPTNHEDEVPVGVSTPIEGHSIESNDLSKLSDQNPQSTTKTRPSETPYPINKVIHSEGNVEIAPSLFPPKKDFRT